MIRPAYWTDADIHTRLSADVREFYIGLWMQSDDEGYIDWDLVRIGAELYPYRGPAWRRVRLPIWAKQLEPHVVVLPCGKHAVIASLPKHQTVPRPSSAIRRQHDRCVALHVHARACSAVQVLEGKEKEGNLREGKSGAEGAIEQSTKTNDDLTTAPWNRRLAAGQS